DSDSDDSDDSDSDDDSSSDDDSDSSSSYSAQSGDLELMSAIIYCEAGGEIYAGQLAVGSVVMNRVNSSSFPNSVSAVIYQSGQFSPVASGRFATVLSNQSWTSSCESAAKEVLAGNLTVDYLYFHSASGWTSDYGERIGNQIFY
nr:cell wall hydrolase [Eubacterium sp.]